ncbi:arylsulfatase [Sphingobacterium cellulitidis]|uniref:sulfatase family protein n=1 Tax=Sphingobacterium cellulitidis TaxID=1768011 RepID=UPI000B941933|nr:arylsulfatase [Sphingobacterium cellulitidis]
MKINYFMLKDALLFLFLLPLISFAQKKPNVVMIYADDLGYGDLSAYGADKIKTPNIDELASAGIRFTNGHSSAATCTPSRYSLMTGKYPFRKTGTGVLPGDAALIIDTAQMTLPKLFKQQGYQTAIIGKWHLGLGSQVEKNWNQEVKPGPIEVGYDYSYIFPATADRVPTVFLEGHKVVGVDPNDPIQVSYKQKIGTEPTGLENPELLKMKASPNHGHNQTIINGIGRIGWMTGGLQARWVDEEVTMTFADKVIQYIRENKNKPFFLSYHATEPHVPRMPSTMFKGKSGLGYRGDAILQLDHTVGEIIQTLKDNGLFENTIIIFTSDNGAVLDDGYVDGAVTQLNGHNPFGIYRGGKYSAFEGGTRVPFIMSWPKGIKKNQVSDALLCQMDLLSSFASFFGKPLPAQLELDGENIWPAFIGKDKKGREYLVQSAGTFSITRGNYKYIKPSKGQAMSKLTNTELGNNPEDQLYNLASDPSEKTNIAKQNPELVAELKTLLESIM